MKPLKLLSKISNIDSVYILGRKYTGNTFVYKPPTDTEINNVKEVALLLSNHRNTTDEVDNILRLLSEINYTITKIQENKNVLVFHPNNKGQLVFFWNFNTSNQSIFSFFHSGLDSIRNNAINQFLGTNSKFFVINGLHPHSSNIPSFEQPNRRISDAAHSKSVLCYYFLEYLLLILYPNSPLYVIHSFNVNDEKDDGGETGGEKNFHLWFINQCNSDYVRGNYKIRSIAALLSIAFVILSFKSESYTDSDYYKVITKGKFLENFMKIEEGENKGEIYSMTDCGKLVNDGKSLMIYKKGLPSTDVQMSIVNYNESYGGLLDSGRGVHIEHGGEYSASSYVPNLKQKCLINAMKLATDWYQRWDSSVHDISNCPKNIKYFPVWYEKCLKK